MCCGACGMLTWRGTGHVLARRLSWPTANSLKVHKPKIETRPKVCHATDTIQQPPNEGKWKVMGIQEPLGTKQALSACCFPAHARS